MSDDIAFIDHDTGLIDSAIELLQADNFTQLPDLSASREPAGIAHLPEFLPDIKNIYRPPHSYALTSSLTLNRKT
jgi:hypothetical protein